MTLSDGLLCGRMRPGVVDGKYYLIDIETGRKTPLATHQYRNCLWWMTAIRVGDIFVFKLEGINYRLQVMERNLNEIKFYGGGFILIETAQFWHPLSYFVRLYPFQVRIER